MATYTLMVPAVPTAQPRTKATAFGGKARVYTPQTIGKDENKRPHPIHAFKATVRMVAQQAYDSTPLTGPLRVDCVFVFPRHSNKFWKSKPTPRYFHTVKPDRDNLDKAVLDALKGTVLADDASVCGGEIWKYHAAGDEQPHCEITITELNGSTTSEKE